MKVSRYQLADYELQGYSDYVFFCNVSSAHKLAFNSFLVNILKLIASDSTSQRASIIVEKFVNLRKGSL